MSAIDTNTAPKTSIMVNKDGKAMPGTSHDTSLKPGLLAIPSVGTYGNGLDVMGAKYGTTTNRVENVVRQVEIPSIHPQSNTAYDKSTAFVAGDPINYIIHEIGKEYWLPASSLTAALDDALITAASGLVALASVNDATVAEILHTWVVTEAVTSASWVKAIYKGKRAHFTTTAE